MAERPAPPRLALTAAEAAVSLGLSESSFKRHVRPHLRAVRKGSVRVYAVSELQKWLDRESTLAGGDGE